MHSLPIASSFAVDAMRRQNDPQPRLDYYRTPPRAVQPRTQAPSRRLTAALLRRLANHLDPVSGYSPA